MPALRSWIGFGLGIAILASNSSIAHSANLTLTTNSSANSPLVVTPLDTSRQLIVSVVNDTDADPTTEFMTAWQFWLRTIPDAGTTGTLNPVAGTVPDNYVFADVAHLGPAAAALPGDPTTLNGLDLILPPDAPPVQIPTAPGKNLLAISLAPSADALGRFGIYVSNRHTLWIDDADSGGFREFVGIPIDDNMTRIGDVLVTSVADFNRDGIVDAADYVVWRSTLGSTTNLAADGDGSGSVDAGDYDVWKMHFGEAVPGAGGGAASFTSAAIPEPTTLTFVGIMISILAGRVFWPSRKFLFAGLYSTACSR